MRVFTTIRNMHDVSRHADGLEDDYDWLLLAEEAGLECEVDCEVCEGYYSVTFENGRTVEALSWYHLEGFTEDSLPLFNVPLTMR